jgi:ribonuclease HI
MRSPTLQRFALSGERHRAGGGSGWQARNWRRHGSDTPNVDLWQQILVQVECHQVSTSWIKGHAGHPDNERCDWLARTAATATDLAVDEQYEQLVVAKEKTSEY